MRIRIDWGSLRRVQAHEYVVRFLLGGAVTVATGLIAKTWGPVVGGLFLAFPAIFPASATLLDKHEREKKRKAGVRSTIRGRLAVGLDARGAALGAIAMIVFALLVWKELPRHNALIILGAAVLAWVIVAAGLWRLRKLHVYFSRRR
jgi:hypothetical protein